MILLHFETRHFEFHTLAETPQEAREALARAWATWCDNMGADPAYVRENEDSIRYLEMEPGLVYVDYGDPIL